MLFSLISTIFDAESGKRQLSRLRLWALLVIVGEYLAQTFWPWAVAVAVLLGIFAQGFASGFAPAFVQLTLLVIVALAIAYGWFFRRPPSLTAFAIDQRLADENRLPTSLVHLIEDELAAASGADLFPAETSKEYATTSQLWQLHKAELIQRIQSLIPVSWSADLTRTDPFAMRYLGLLLVVVLCLTGGGSGMKQLWTKLSTPMFAGDWSLSGSPENLAVSVWLVPPEYTNKQPLVLPLQVAEQDPITIPQNSILRAETSEDGNFTIRFDGDTEKPLQRLNSEQQRLEVSIGKTNTITLLRNGKSLFHWPITIVPDAPPTVQFVRIKDADKTSGKAAIKDDTIRLEATDDYGINNLSFVVKPVIAAIKQSIPPKPAMEKAEGETSDTAVNIAPDAITLALWQQYPEWFETAFPLASPNPPQKKLQRRISRDLTAHPLAGFPVELRGIATDASGQTGEATIPVTLPERTFQNPLAFEIIALRKQLIVQPIQQRLEVARRLKVMTTAMDMGFMIGSGDGTKVYPTNTIRPATYLALTVAASRIRSPDYLAEVPNIWALLWDAAVSLEINALPESEKRLSEAMQNLSDKLNDKTTSPEELDSAMQEVQQALQEYLQEMAKLTQQQMNLPPTGQPPQNQLSMDDFLQQMMDAAKMGGDKGREQAASQLEALQNFLSNLKRGANTMQSPEAQAQMQQFKEDIQALKKITESQKALMGETEQALKDLSKSKNSEAAKGKLADLKARQADLRKQLGEVMASIGSTLPEIPSNLADAEQAMRKAEQALAEATGSSATTAQQTALDALQDGAEQAMQSLMQSMLQIGVGQGQQQQPSGQLWNGSGNADTSSVDVPDQGGLNKSRAILQDLQEKATDQDADSLYKQYYQRLLDLF